MSNDITVALIAVGGTALGGIISSVTTYCMQKRQMKNESQSRVRRWALKEYNGRTAALQKTINLIVKLYHSQRSPKSEQLLLRAIRDELLQSSWEPDFRVIGQIYSELEQPCSELVPLINQVAEMDDLKASQAMQILEEAHGLSLTILNLMVKFKRELLEVKP